MFARAWTVFLTLARNSGGASMRGNPVTLDEPRLQAILRGMA